MKIPRRRPARSWSRGGVAKKLLLLLLTSMVVVLGLEWAVRRYLPIWGQIYGPDKELLFDAIPGSSRIQVMPRENVGEGDAARVLVRIGAEGFRGGDLESPKLRKRLLVIGDSFVMAENVPEDRTFVRALGRELGSRLVDPDAEGADAARQIETVNAGRSSYGPDQALLLLRRNLERVRPDLVVCVLCAHNDFGDLMRNKLFYLGEDGRAEPAQPVLGARMVDAFAERRARSDRPALQRLWQFWQKNRQGSVASDTVVPSTLSLYARALESQAREHLVARDPEVVSLFKDVYDIDVAASIPDSFAPAKVELMVGVLARMTKLTSKAGVPVVFVVVPSAVDVCSNFELKVDPARFPGHRKAALVDAMVGAVGLAGGVAIDVTPALTGEGPADRYFVGGQDIHWNAAGQAVSASYVAEELLRDHASARALGAEEAR